MPSSETQRVGAIAEFKFITLCLERGFEPHLPLTPMPWDCIVTCPAGDLKVQVKASQRPRGSGYCITTSTGCGHKEKISDEVDVVACYVVPVDTWWMIPRFEVTGTTAKLYPQNESKGKYKKYQNNWSIYYK